MDKSTQRETYLDILKGIAMLLVVMQHVGGQLNGGLVFLCKIDVPLFFVVSGYLALKSNMVLQHELIKKTKRVAIPFVAAVLFASFWYGRSIYDTITDIGKSGYWFLLCLFLFFLLFYTLHRFVKGRFLLIGSCIIEFILLGLSKFAPTIIDNIIGISYMARYFPCFIAGVFIRKLDIRDIHRAIGSLFLIIAYVAFTYKGGNTNISFLLHILGYVSASLTIFFFIRRTECIIPSVIKSMLCYIGKGSLAIYIIHFYFVTSLAISTGSFVIDFVCVLCMSLIIIFLSLILKNILVNMTFLDRIL